ncbi:Uncharacterized protein TCM_004703 [Theobroma cacao]|uniref:Uncharacterized protein n=1 Tax=Theobroma cacao TaxID=3641 RepID=A0A061DQV5_THECC|nr:Uncharacterized protein TCM_004703 [Theobroma cacao]
MYVYRGMTMVGGIMPLTEEMTNLNRFGAVGTTHEGRSFKDVVSGNCFPPLNRRAPTVNPTKTSGGAAYLELTCDDIYDGDDM